MNEAINLLEPRKKGASEVLLRRLDKTRVIMTGILFIVSVASVILFILVALSPLPALQNQEQTMQDTLARSKNDIVKYELVNERLDAISTTLAKRQVLDQDLSLIESKIPPDVRIIEIKANNLNVTMTVESQSLQSLDSFLNGLIGYVQNKISFSDVTMSALTTNSVNNSYDITVSLSLLSL
jgi:hypothetical protein